MQYKIAISFLICIAIVAAAGAAQAQSSHNSGGAVELSPAAASTRVIELGPASVRTVPIVVRNGNFEELIPGETVEDAVRAPPKRKAAKFAASDSRSIIISGRIQLGDEAHFQSSLLRLKGRGPIEVHLNSPGGSLEAAMKIAEIVRKAGLTTRVPYRAYCASACTLVFAAGVNRIAHAVSRIEVHSSSGLERPGVENDNTLAGTIKWARRMSSYGAPPSVVGKLVTTPTNRMTRLTVADLEAWNVKIERDIPGKAISKAGSAAAVPVMSPPGFDSVPRPPTAPSFASPGVLAPSNPNPLQLAPPAMQPTIPDRVGQPSGPPDPAQPSTSQSPVAAVTQRVVLYEEDPADPQGNRYVGSAIWRTETVTPRPGAPADLAVHADLEIPGRRITMTFALRRNSDKALPASHTIEVKFNLPADFPFGGIQNVPGILMKQAEQTRGAPLAGLAVKVTSGFFLVGLSAVKADMQRNLQLLKERAWFDVPIVYNNGRRAILAIEKGNPGERAFEEAFKAWEQTSADLAPSSGILAPLPDIANPNPLQVVPLGAQPVALPPAADPSQAELAWAVTKDTTTIAVLEEFVRRYGDSHYAALARTRMEELRKSQAAAPPLVPPQPSAAATNAPKRVRTVTIRTEVASPPIAAAPSAAPGGAAYVVQVSAQRTETEAQSSYRALQQKYPAVLGSRDARILRVDLGTQGGIFYRAHVGSFATSEQATAFCNNLKDAGGQCIVQRGDWGGPGPGEPPPASLRGGSAIAESSEAMKYENKKTPPDAAEPPLHTADTLTRGVAIDERGCKARSHELASEGLRLAADCAKEGDDAAPTARHQTETPPSARGREAPAVRPQPVSAEPRERERKAAEPRRAAVELPPSKPALAPRHAKSRGSAGRCFVLGGRSFCE